MRITHHGDDLLVTDQSLGLGAFLVTIGVFMLVVVASRLTDGSFATFGTLAYAALGAGAVKVGFDRMVATQIIVDVDEKLLITKRWSVAGTKQQRIPFDAATGFTIEPKGSRNKTELYVQTTRGPVSITGGTKAVREAWEEVQSAVETHMGRRESMDHVDD